MRFAIPATVPADTFLGKGYSMLWLGCTDDNNDADVEVALHNDFDGVLASGYGATPADAMCGLLSAFPDSDEVRLPACVAAALDELAHQAVRVVCQRLSGGTLDDATFAEPHLLDTQSGPVDITTVGAAPDPHAVPGGDTAMSTLLPGEEPPGLFDSGSKENVLR